MPPNDKQYGEIARELREATSQLVETTTMLRTHIVEQRGINQRMERLVGDHDKRLRAVESWQAAIDERLPATLIDGDEYHADMAGLSGKVDGLALKIAKWSGGVAALTTVVIWIAKAVIG